MSEVINKAIPTHADVVIVGAGVSGLYCAWRILDKDPSTNVLIVDRLNRTGGRLDTDLIQIGDNVVRDEEGGMRFNYGMQELMAVNGALGLCDDIIPFPMQPDPSGPNYNRYSIRGKSFTVQEAEDNKNIWSELYNLDDSEQGKSPVEIITDVYHTIVHVNGGTVPETPTPEFWQTFRLDYSWNNTPLNEWQLGGLLRDMGHSEECITMLSHTIGFEAPFLSLANAGEAFQILEDFPKDPHYFTFKKGFSTLPNALKTRVLEAGGQICLGVNVNNISKSGDDFVLNMTQAEQGQSSSRFAENGTLKTVEAPKIILAVASKAMQSLYASSAIFNQATNANQLEQDLQGVVDMRLLKINLYFSHTWWEQEQYLSQPIQYGPSFTDLPINAVYPFYSLQGPANADNPAALTIYCDFNNSNFWQGLQNVKPDFDSPLQRKHSQSPQVIFPASQAVVQEAIKQITELYKPAKPIPIPVMSSYRLWGGEDDFGYAYHQWALNADDRQIMQRLIEPVSNVYTCNEAYSDMQGWVNGSLRSADKVLERFGITPLVGDHNNKPCTECS